MRVVAVDSDLAVPDGATAEVLLTDEVTQDDGPPIGPHVTTDVQDSMIDMAEPTARTAGDWMAPLDMSGADQDMLDLLEVSTVNQKKMYREPWYMQMAIFMGGILCWLPMRVSQMIFSAFGVSYIAQRVVIGPLLWVAMITAGYLAIWLLA